MMASKINEKASRYIPYLLVAGFSSLVTSWGLQTPVLQQKADTLAVVQQKVLPSLAGQLAETKTKLKQANCDENKIADVAVQGLVATHDPAAPLPQWSDFTPCQKVAPVKVPVPVVTLAAKK